MRASSWTEQMGNIQLGGWVTSPIYLLEYKLALNPLSYATAGLGLSQHFENPNEITENITFPTNLKFE